MLICITILHNKRNKPCVMIMYMNNIGLITPFAKPINYCYLKSHEAFGIITIAINLFTIKQAMNIYHIKSKAKLIRCFFDDGVMEIHITHAKLSFMNNIKFVVEKKLCFMHRCDHLCFMA